MATSTAAVFYYVLTTVEWLHQQQRYYNWGGAPHTLSIGLCIYCGRLGYLNMGNYGQLWWQVIFNEKLDWIYIGRFGVLVVGLPGLLVESRWKSLNGYASQQAQPPDWTMNDGGMPDKLVAIRVLHRTTYRPVSQTIDKTRVRNALTWWYLKNSSCVPSVALTPPCHWPQAHSSGRQIAKTFVVGVFVFNGTLIAFNSEVWCWALLGNTRSQSPQTTTLKRGSKPS